MTTELRAPWGKVRVVCYKPRKHSMHWVGDYKKRRAFRIVNRRNGKRKTGMYPIFLAYDTLGNRVCGDLNPDGPGFSP